MSWSAKPEVWTGGAAVLDAWAPTDLASAPAPVVAGPSPEDAIADAYALGFAEGRHEGEEGERARLRSSVRVAEEALESIDAADAKWTGSAEENVLALALAVARHIVDRELSLDPEVVSRLVRRALDEFPLDEPVKVRVHPDDFAIIESLDEGGTRLALDHAERNAHWIADSRIGLGGCVVEGRARIVDGRIDTALERLYRRLTHQHG